MVRANKFTVTKITGNGGILVENIAVPKNSVDRIVCVMYPRPESFAWLYTNADKAGTEEYESTRVALEYYQDNFEKINQYS